MKSGQYFRLKKILITGASSGIGQGLAIRLSQLGAELILTGRNQEKLNQVAALCSGKVDLVLGDLTDPVTLEKLASVVSGLDIAILNAGTNWYMDATTFNATSFNALIQQNLFTMSHCLEIVIPEVLKSKGQVALMGSLAGYGGLSQSAAYGASKAAIRILAQSLDVDLRPLGVAVTCVSPGFVKTPLTDLNTFKMPVRISVEKAVDIILAGLKQKAHEIHFPKSFSLMMKVMMSLPASWQYMLSKQFKEKP